MTSDPYVHIEHHKVDEPVYRITPVHRLLAICRSRTLTLVQPKCWDDPFDNLISWSLLTHKYPMMGTDENKLNAWREKAANVRSPIYGQCWTYHSETDAMWRIYSPGKDGVRMKSTPRKLVGALQDDVEQPERSKCFIGEVQYKSKKDLETIWRGIDDLDGPNRSGVAKVHTYKRPEFKHEAEVRLLFTGVSGEVHSVRIDPNRLIDEVTFDPRMDKELVEAYERALRCLGYEGIVNQSELYRPPEICVFNL